MEKRNAAIVILVLLLCIALVLFRGALFKTKKNSPEPGSQTSNTATIVKGTDTSVPYLKITYQYPTGTIGASVIKDRVTAIIADWKKENDISKLSEQDKEMMGLTEGRTYELYIKYTHSENTKLYTHRLEIYSFTGGAHGITTIETYSFDASGKNITYTDIFTNPDTGLEALKVKLREKLFTNFSDRLYNDPSMVEEGLSGEALKELPFNAVGDGISFTFGQYQVGPYVSGIIDVPLTSKDLEGIVKPEFLP